MTVQKSVEKTKSQVDDEDDDEYEDAFEAGEGAAQHNSAVVENKSRQSMPLSENPYLVTQNTEINANKKIIGESSQDR